jgi:hypothetical protein
MENNNIDDKWLIVYQGYLAQYKDDYAKDSYNDKLVLVTGNKKSPSIDARKSYLCVANEENSIEIPIPDLWIEKIQIGNDTRSWTTRVLNLAKENGINISFGDDGKTVTIGIDKDTRDKIDSIDNKVEQTEYNDKVAELEASIGGKYTKPAGGIPAKDLAAEVATETEVVNAINKAAADLNNKIDNKISKTDTLPAENVGVLSNGAKGLASTNPIIANRIPYLKADAFAFLQPEDFTVEVKYNDEVNWLTLDNNNADMRGMFAQWNVGTGFPIDGSNTSWKVGSKIRITLAPKADRNAKVDFVALNVYANGRAFDILTEYYDSSPSKEGWYSVGDQLNISSNGICFVKYNQYFSYAGYARGGARFTFTITHNTQYGSKIVGISGFGNQAAEISPTSSTAPYTLGTLWYWDYLKNVYFPNDIYEGGTPLKNKYASISEIPTVLPNPKSLKYTVNGMSYTYDGSSETTIPQIFTPTQIGSQGQLLQSMGGGAPQWTNLSSIKEAIGFAKDLTGVLEATPEEFTFRPSAGNKSIRDEGAVIRRIKGNTTVWGQLADITNVTNVSNRYIMEKGDGWFSIQRDLSDPNTPYCRVDMDEQYNIPSHIYLLTQELEVSGIETSNDSCSAAAYNFINSTSSTIENYKQNGKYLYAKIRPKLDDTTFCFFYYAYGNAKLRVSNIQCFDLTSIFGAGNEPTTYEEFKAIYPDIYPYCEPEIRNVKTTAIETVGFNQWDEQWEKGRFDSETGVNVDYSDNIRCKNPIKVLPNTVYSVYVGGSRSYVFAMFFDNNGNVLTPIIYSEDSWINEKRLCISSNVHYNAFITPEGASWMKFYLHTDYGSTYTNDVSISLFHSGIRRGEYEPYKKNTLLLPEITKYFHNNGMNGIGDVCDEINSENAIQRIGFVDIGELEWYTGSQKHMFLAPIENAKPTIWNEVTNAIMFPYTAVSRIEADTADMSFCVNNIYHFPNRVCLTNYNYEDAASFKAAMSGVYLYYELAEPEIRPISEPIQLVYDVEDFGTERAISPENSAPFRADIVYQFNAEGRIRDNGRNIERLEKSTNILNFNIEGLKGRFKNEFVVAEGLLSSNGKQFHLPSSRSENQLYNLATEQYVINNIPTEVATATQLKKVDSLESIAIAPNIMYEYTSGIGETGRVIFPERLIPPGSYDYTWMLRFPSIASSKCLIFRDSDIRWKDGIPPTFSVGCALEIYIKEDAMTVLGEWKIYR